MDVGYRLDHPFFITQKKKCFIHWLRYCVYACNAMPFYCSVYICRYRTLHYTTLFHRFDIPYHQKYFVVPLFIWAVINCVPKPVPGRNNKHQESDIYSYCILLVAYNKLISLSRYVSLFVVFFFIFYFQSEDIKHISSP